MCVHAHTRTHTWAWPGRILHDHWIDSSSTLLGILKLLSKVVIQVYKSHQQHWGFLLFCEFSNTVLTRHFTFANPLRWNLISFLFSFAFPWLPVKDGSFYVFIGHFSLLCEFSVCVLCLFFRWVVCLFLIDLEIFFINSGYLSCIIHVFIFSF